MQAIVPTEMQKERGMRMEEGLITTITDREFGFIQPDNAPRRVFFHASALVGVTFDELRRGDRVRFTLEPDLHNSRMRAHNIHRVE